MAITREQFLGHIHVPLQTTARPSSPTKSTYRVRWRQLSEWNDFILDARTYWDDLPDTQKSAVLTGVPPNYWDVLVGTLADIAPSVTQEPHLGTPFAVLYSAPHNKAINGAVDDHARITTQLPPTTVGQPDGCFEYDDRLTGIIELKSFWNLTERTILEVLQGPILILG